MSLPSPQRMRLIGGVAGLLIFAVPLALLYASMKAELSSQGAPEAVSAAPAGQIARAGAGAGGEALPSGPLALEIARRSGPDVELRLRNVSQGRLRIAVPAAAGDIIRFVAVGSAPKGPAGPCDPAAWAVIELLPGDAYSRVYRDAVEPGRGPIRALYDSRVPNLPEGAWSGRVESPVAP